MGLFFRGYDKAGPGIDKDAPKKKGVFLFFELFFRKFWLLIKANLLYVLVSLPILVIYNFVVLNALNMLAPNTFAGATMQVSVILTVLIAALWGTGPVSCGYTYLLRNFAREEHVWLVSDFFEKIKENFKLGITVMIIDILVLFLGTSTVSVYISLIKQGMGFAKYGLALFFGVLIIYTFMHFYVYELAVTFENKVKGTLKNSFIMAFATLPMNILLAIIVTILTFAAFSRLSVIAIIGLTLVIWISVVRFIIDFYSARTLKKRFIHDEENLESVE